MSDVAREMLRGFGLAMALDVPTNQRVAKIREIREQEFAAQRVVEPEDTVELVVRNRQCNRKAITGSLPWIPVHSAKDARESLGDEGAGQQMDALEEAVRFERTVPFRVR